MYPTAIISLFISYQLFPAVQGGATLDIHFLEYDNSDGKDWNGDDCDITGSCDHMFTICIDEYNSASATTSSLGACALHAANNPSDSFEGGTNVNDFQSEPNINGVSNPLQITLAIWSGFKLKVAVEDHDPTANHDKVDIFDKALFPLRAKSAAQASYSPATAYGTRTDAVASSLKLEYKVYCDPDYYGLDCAVYCKAQDLPSGHYNCDSDTGSRVCLPGWEGSNCQDSVDYCLSDPCLHNGSCIAAHLSYNCSCQENYEGVNCEEILDQCEHLSVQCLNGGSCQNGTCICSQGFEGDMCQVDQCDLIMCQNGSSCLSGACVCPDGYTGDTCEDISSPDTEEGNARRTLIIACVVGGLLVIAAIVTCIVIVVVIMRRRKRNREDVMIPTTAEAAASSAHDNPVYDNNTFQSK